MPTFIYDFWPKRTTLPPQRRRTQVRAFSGMKVLQPQAELTNRIYGVHGKGKEKKEERLDPKGA